VDWRDDVRDFRRMTVDCQLEFRPVNGGEMRTGQARDLSATGIAFMTTTPVAEGDELEVKIDSGSSLLHAIVKVMRVSSNDDGSHDVGCQIIGMQ
jgi:hypothetical protein